MDRLYAEYTNYFTYYLHNNMWWINYSAYDARWRRCRRRAHAITRAIIIVIIIRIMLYPSTNTFILDCKVNSRFIRFLSIVVNPPLHHVRFPNPPLQPTADNDTIIWLHFPFSSAPLEFRSLEENRQSTTNQPSQHILLAAEEYI